MNANTYNQVVNPVFAVLATPKQNPRNSKQQFKQKKQKPSTFDSLFSTACDTADEMTIIHDTGCYGVPSFLSIFFIFYKEFKHTFFTISYYTLYCKNFS